MLLTIARFDPDNTGRIDERERQAKGQEMVSDAATTCSSMSVVASLMIGLSHLQAIGRPNPWDAAPAFVDEYGDRPYNRSGWVTDCRVELDPACADKAYVDP